MGSPTPGEHVPSVASAAQTAPDPAASGAVMLAAQRTWWASGGTRPQAIGGGG